MKRQATDLSENICKTHIQQKINISNFNNKTIEVVDRRYEDISLKNTYRQQIKHKIFGIISN